MRRRFVVSSALAIATAAVAGAGRLPAQAPIRDGPVFFTCGADKTSPAPLPVTSANVMLAGDSRLFAPCPDGPHPATHLEQRWTAVIAAAERSPLPELRRVAARALGDLGRDTSAFLRDPSPIVRREAAIALGDAYGAANAADVAVVLEARLKLEAVPEVVQALLESVGRVGYLDAAARAHAESLLVANATGPSVRVLGAVKGLESLLRQDARREITPATRERLRALGATTGADETSLRIRRLALTALQTARDLDIPTLERAAADSDWQVRRLAALRLDLARADMAGIASRLDLDPASPVRYEVVSAEARRVQQTHVCGPLVRRLADSSTTVVLRALDGMAAGCADAAAVAVLVAPMAAGLDRPDSAQAWHVPARALVALARLQPETAAPMIARAAVHGEWQVRAAAVAAAAVVGDDRRLEALADDPAPNVRTAALEQMARQKVPSLYPTALRALRSGDYQLVRAAATALVNVPPDLADEATRSLLASLARLTDERTDTSRDPRVAVLGALSGVLPVARVSELSPYLGDFDPKVREAAQKTYQAVAKTPPPVVAARYRYPLQPAAAALVHLPAHASLTLAGVGTLKIDLTPSATPITVARFATLVRDGYYNGLTFHRVVPNFVIQGGSPGANEYVGADRYMRDELGGEPHLRGSVGISTRGRDTGDGQLFIDLVDVPRLDHDYTVFGRVTSGLDLLEKVLEGTRIERIVIH